MMYTYSEISTRFMCYCETAGGTLAKSIEDAETKIPKLESDIKAAESAKAQLEKDLESHKAGGHWLRPPTGLCAGASRR